MIGGLIMAMGAAEMLHDSLYSDKMVYEERDRRMSVGGTLYQPTDLSNYYLKDGNIEVFKITNCFGETYAMEARSYDSNKVPDCYGYAYIYKEIYQYDKDGADDTTFFVNEMCMTDNYINRKLYKDKTTGRRLVEWNGYYFDADTSQPVREIKTDKTIPELDMRKIWVVNEVLKDQMGISFWQMMSVSVYDAKEKLIDRFNYMHNKYLYGIDMSKQNKVDYVEFRETCKKSIPYIKKEYSLSYTIPKTLQNEDFPDTTYSTEEHKRKTSQSWYYRAII